jgi:DNA-binding transcriptional LysR family regulator
MKLIDIGAFGPEMDRGSVVGASAAPQLTQSKVTRWIHNFEVTLGTRLLDWQTRPLCANAETHEFAKSVLSSVGHLKLAMMHDGGPRGDFRGGV